MARCDVPSWRILAINVVAAFFGKPNQDWSMCEENTAYGGRIGRDEEPCRRDRR